MARHQNVHLGIVGCGDHSHVHAAAARDIPGVEIVCASDIDVEMARAWAARHGGQAYYDSLEAMLRHQHLDGVILCTWPSLHAEQILSCLAAGVKNILCEKALVTSAAEARLVHARVQQHAANLVEASMHRHHPALRKLERILEIGDIGPIDCVRAAFHNYEPAAVVGPSAASDWRYRADCGGGVVYDWMHYAVDACNHFNASAPKRAFAAGSISPHGQVIDRIYGLIEYANGQVGIIESSKHANFSNALQITCAHGILQLPIAWAIGGEVTITQTHRKPEWDYILEDCHKIAKTNAYALQLQNFCDVVNGTAKPRVPLHDSITNAMTTEALVESMRQRRAVDVEAVGL